MLPFPADARWTPSALTRPSPCSSPSRSPQVQTVNIKSLGADYELVDGDRLQLPVKDLGSSDLYPQVRFS